MIKKNKVEYEINHQIIFEKEKNQSFCSCGPTFIIIKNKKKTFGKEKNKENDSWIINKAESKGLVWLFLLEWICPSDMETILDGNISKSS